MNSYKIEIKVRVSGIKLLINNKQKKHFLHGKEKKYVLQQD
jgi:hypothetical protein